MTGLPRYIVLGLTAALLGCGSDESPTGPTLVGVGGQSDSSELTDVLTGQKDSGTEVEDSAKSDAEQMDVTSAADGKINDDEGISAGDVSDVAAAVDVVADALEDTSDAASAPTDLGPDSGEPEPDATAKDSGSQDSTTVQSDADEPSDAVVALDSTSPTSDAIDSDAANNGDAIGTDAQVGSDAGPGGPDGACIPVAEICDGLDQDCDGVADNGVSCDDGNACTNDLCDGKAGCKHSVKPTPKPCKGAVVGSKCYRAFQHVPRTWTNSQKACAAWGGDLASVASTSENAALLKHGQSVCGVGLYAWIGLNDEAKEGQFEWSNGAAVTFTNWSAGEPNNLINEDYAAMVYDGKWNDYGASFPLVCTLCERPTTNLCDDGTACTSDDLCNQKGVCIGKPLQCDDGNACTTDICDSKVGCSSGKLADGSTCAQTGVCKAGLCEIGTKANPATSCLAIKTANKTITKSGLFYLDGDGPKGTDAYKAWCDMETDGGGWTLVMKIDGGDSEFDYDDKRWTEKKAYKPSNGDLKQDQTKLPSYWQVPHTELLLGMRANSTTKWLQVPLVGTSLHALISTGKSVATKVGRAQWLSLINNASLQVHCNQEGINVGTSHARVRIGIVGNNEKDCKTPDSRLGFGGRGKSCGQKDGISCGNTAKCGGHKGDRATEAFGWIFVR